MSVCAQRTHATSLRCLRIVALGALAWSAAAQGALVPVLITQPDPALSDASINSAKAYFYSPFSTLTAPSVVGNIITVSLVPQPCSPVCGASGYYGYWFVLPAVAAGDYRFHVVDGAHPSQVLQDFPLSIGGTTPNPPPQQIETIPAIPLSRQPFTIKAYFLPPYAASSLVTIDGAAVTTLFFACGFNECPPDIIYGPYSVAAPGLLSGTHRVRFNNYYAPNDPPFAEFDVIVRGPDPIPSSRTPALLLLALILAGIARRHLRTRDSNR